MARKTIEQCESDESEYWDHQEVGNIFMRKEDGVPQFVIHKGKFVEDMPTF